ncbi:hypothetical protein AC629_37610 [Bradyrhizobium sp. NAS80.1]|nr:hypothetical protein AC629_37610 [Bradyrhizobium sp. NAS80.1]
MLKIRAFKEIAAYCRSGRGFNVGVLISDKETSNRINLEALHKTCDHAGAGLSAGARSAINFNNGLWMMRTIRKCIDARADVSQLLCHPRVESLDIPLFIQSSRNT